MNERTYHYIGQLQSYRKKVNIGDYYHIWGEVKGTGGEGKGNKIGER